jgi:hypothetical protein
MKSPSGLVVIKEIGYIIMVASLVAMVGIMLSIMKLAPMNLNLLGIGVLSHW